jgi:2-methylcitrate dehydratase PrpD
MSADSPGPAAAFISELDWHALPDPVRHQARRCLLDTLGAAVGGRQTPLSAIVHTFAAEAYAGSGARLWLDGRSVSPPGAALANGMTIDALDIHDGFALTKGHAGAAVVPAALATLSLAPADRPSPPVSGSELLTAVVVGYEVALRAGLALHATACDYHTSGAWNALGCAAVTARRLALDPEQTRHALGIAEYHGPRSQMMRCIDHPTMVKDGSGWGAMAGVSAGLLAGHGFTGAPAITVEAAEAASFWSDLGRRWLITEQYFKPHAVCRWAQPAITGALALRQAHGLEPAAIRRIRVFTFHEAVRLGTAHPATTEEAQYSLPFPLAAALVHGRLGGSELSGAALSEPLILRLAGAVELIEQAAYNDHFPARRLARVQIETADGKTWDSGEVEAAWGAEDPPDDRALLDKFRDLAGPLLPHDRLAALEAAAWRCEELADAGHLAELLAAPTEG